jgi:AraC-like DNA-binding protein
MSGTFYCRSELTAPWGLSLPPRKDCLSFHVVTSGSCRLGIEGSEDRLLESGDLALVPRGEGHRLSSAPGTPAPRVDVLPHEYVSDRYAILRHGGGGAPASLVCGAVRFDHPVAHDLVRLLPPVIHVKTRDSSHAELLQSTLRLMAAEARELRPGGETVITRLADILVIQALRAWIEQDPAAQTGWLGALRDRHVGRAIALVHRDPARPWTVASLASEVAMSRSAFAARFTQLVGEPPMRYLSRWRMHLALTLLRTEHLSIGEAASRLGYRSEAAFSRAFKRCVGFAASQARRDSSSGSSGA